MIDSVAQALANSKRLNCKFLWILRFPAAARFRRHRPASVAGSFFGVGEGIGGQQEIFDFYLPVHMDHSVFEGSSLSTKEKRRFCIYDPVDLKSPFGQQKKNDKIGVFMGYIFFIASFKSSDLLWYKMRTRSDFSLKDAHP